MLLRHELRHSSKKAKKKKRNSSFAQKYKAEQFLSDYYVSGDMLGCKFCHHNCSKPHGSHSLIGLGVTIPNK